MKEVCSRLDCSDDTVRRLVDDGLLSPPKHYPRLGPRFSEDDVERFIFTQGTDSPPSPKARQDQE